MMRSVLLIFLVFCVVLRTLVFMAGSVYLFFYFSVLCFLLFFYFRVVFLSLDWPVLIASSVFYNAYKWILSAFDFISIPFTHVIIRKYIKRFWWHSHHCDYPYFGLKNILRFEIPKIYQKLFFVFSQYDKSHNIQLKKFNYLKNISCSLFCLLFLLQTIKMIQLSSNILISKFSNTVLTSAQLIGRKRFLHYNFCL
jgi:hypothetical protein